MPCETAFKGRFSFVNVDASGLSTQPHRHKVSRHLHVYRRWNKGQQARRLLESSRFHEAVDQDLQRPMMLSPPTEPDVFLPQTSAPPSRSRTLQSLPPIIDLILQNGNSDPFDVLPEQVTAMVSSLLGFERDCIYPSVKRLEWHMTPQETPFSEIWYGETKAYLYDNLSIHNYLSRIATNMYLVTQGPEYLEAARRFRHKGVTSLRLYMSDMSKIDILRLYRALLILLFADSALDDRDAMDAHTAILKDIFTCHYQVLVANPAYSLHHFVSVVYFDVQNAVLGLSRTSFDLTPGEWVERHFVPLWDQVSSTSTISRPAADRSFDPWLRGELRHLFLAVQETLDIITEVREGAHNVTPSTWFYAISKVTFNVGRLMNLYTRIDVKRLLVLRDDDATPVSTLHALDDACACLCAVYWLREIGGIESVLLWENVRIFTANYIIMGKVRQILESSKEYINLGQTHNDDGRLRLLLWVLWSGAAAENSDSGIASSTGDRTWFTRRFGDVVQRAQVQTPAQCQSILDRFLFLGRLRPNRDEWFDGSVQTSDAREIPP